MKNLTVIAFSIIVFGIFLTLLDPCFTDETIESKESEKAEKTKETKVEKNGVITNSIGMKLKWIEPGEFMMGSDKNDNEKPVHKVKLTKGFYIGVYEVTQEQYEKVMGTNPSEFKGANLPVETVSWNEANEFCKKLSEKEGKTYRLPTEAEWEYACRAGTKTEYYWGDEFDAEFVCYLHNSDGRIQSIGSRKPNKWGLYNICGNVSEWCQDWYNLKYTINKQVNPVGPASGDSKVVRGGTWGSAYYECRSTTRTGARPDSKGNQGGFRIVLASEK